MSTAESQSGRSDPIESVLSAPTVGSSSSAVAFGVESELMAGGVVVVRVAGELDMLTAPTLTEHVDDCLRGYQSITRLVFDLTHVSFLGSAGLAALAEAHRRTAAMGARVWVAGTSHVVLRPIRITGLDGVLTLVGDLASALDGAD